MRWCKQLLDVLTQLAALSPPPEVPSAERAVLGELALRASQACLDVNRGVVAWSGL